MMKLSCESVFTLYHTVVLMPFFSLHQLIWSPNGIVLFLALALLYRYHTFTWHHLNECAIQLGNLPSLSSGRKLEQGTYVTTFSCINAALWNYPMKSHTTAESLSKHPGKVVAQSPREAALGAPDLIADVSFSGASVRFCFYLSAWSRGAVTGIFFIIIFIIMRRREGGLFSAQCCSPSL